MNLCAWVIHLYTFGSLEKAALRAVEIGANTLQIFSASPRMWRARAPGRGAKRVQLSNSKSGNW